MPTRTKRGRHVTTLVAQSAAEGRRAPAAIADKPAPRVGGVLRSVLHSVEQLLGANDSRARQAAKKRVRRRKARLAERIGDGAAQRIVEAFTGDASSAVAILAAAGPEARPFLEAALVKLGKLVDELTLDDVGALTEATAWAVQSGFAAFHSAQAAKAGDDKWFRMARESTERASLCLERARQLQRAANDARAEREQRKRWGAAAPALPPNAGPQTVDGDGADDAAGNEKIVDDARLSPDNDPGKPSAASDDAEPELSEAAHPGPASEPESPPPSTMVPSPPAGFVDAAGNACDAWGQLVVTRSAVDPDLAERTISAGNARAAKLIAEYEHHEAIRRRQQRPTDPPDFLPKPNGVGEALAQVCVRPPLVSAHKVIR